MGANLDLRFDDFKEKSIEELEKIINDAKKENDYLENKIKGIISSEERSEILNSDIPYNNDVIYYAGIILEEKRTQMRR